MKHLVSVIIINWNGEKYLRDCISSLLSVKTEYNFEVIIVDNGSDDGSLEYIKSQAESLKSSKINIKLIKNEKNLGFAPANNQGFKLAKGDLILFLNNDTKATSSFLEPLAKALFSDDTIAGVQPKIVMMDNPQILDSTGSFFTKTGILYHRGHQRKDMGQFENQDEIFSMKGACMLFKKNILNKVGVFDGDFFAYFEETDLCHRLWLSGYRILYVPGSKIYHKGGGTTSRVGSSFIQYHSFKNRIASYITNFEANTLLYLLPAHIFLSIIASFGFLATGKIKHFLAVHKAFLWNISHLGLIFKKRRRVQKKLRKIRDNDYLPKISRSVSLIYYWYLLVGGLEKFQEN